jgi:hypothetical protein
MVGACIEVWLAVAVLCVVVSGNACIVHQQMNALWLFGLKSLGESLDFFLLGNITWQAIFHQMVIQLVTCLPSTQ